MKRRNAKAPKTIRPLRVERRPDPREWADDELMTLPEAAALFWPEGPLTTTSLRTAVRDRMLEVAEIAGKVLTTKAGRRRFHRRPPTTGAGGRAPNAATRVGPVRGRL
jgi:hypothetical protein